MAVVEVEKQLPKDLADQEIGSIRIKRVQVDLSEDSDGEPTLRIALILSDPLGKAETWPIKDIWGLREVVYEAMIRIDQPFSWFIEFQPEHPGDIGGLDVNE